MSRSTAKPSVFVVAAASTPTWAARAITIGIRCDPSSAGLDPLAGCSGDYFAIEQFGAELDEIPVPISAQNPQRCNEDAAFDAGLSYLQDYAVRHYRRYYGGVAPSNWLETDGWNLYKTYCRDLTGDGQTEMIAHWLGPTGGALDPWAIFTRDSTGHWKIVYAQVRDTTYRLSFKGRTVVAPKVARYEGAFTNTYRKRTVSWNGRRFRSRVGPVYKVHNSNRH